MYAILRDSTYETPESARSSEAMAEFQQLHSSQPGYKGNVVVDAGNGRLFTLTIWETGADAAAARSALETEVRRLLGALMKYPSRLIGTGEVTTFDLTYP
jgi:hypothetical protein